MATLTQYKFLQIVESTGAGGAALTADLKALADNAPGFFSENIDPTTATDADHGYYKGALHYNTTNETFAILVDDTTGAAVWKPIASGGGSGSSGYSGYSGQQGLSGYSGQQGAQGVQGYSGYSGAAGSGGGISGAIADALIVKKTGAGSFYTIDNTRPTLNLVDAVGGGTGALDFYTYGGQSQTVPTVRLLGVDLGNYEGQMGFYVAPPGSANPTLGNPLTLNHDHVSIVGSIQCSGNINQGAGSFSQFANSLSQSHDDVAQNAVAIVSGTGNDVQLNVGSATPNTFLLLKITVIGVGNGPTPEVGIWTWQHYWTAASNLPWTYETVPDFTRIGGLGASGWTVAPTWDTADTNIRCQTNSASVANWVAKYEILDVRPSTTSYFMSHLGAASEKPQMPLPQTTSTTHASIMDHMKPHTSAAKMLRDFQSGK